VGGRGNEKIPKNSENRKIAKNDQKIASIYYICTMYENQGGPRLSASAAHVLKSYFKYSKSIAQ